MLLLILVGTKRWMQRTWGLLCLPFEHQEIPLHLTLWNKSYESLSRCSRWSSSMICRWSTAHIWRSSSISKQYPASYRSKILRRWSKWLRKGPSVPTLRPLQWFSSSFLSILLRSSLSAQSLYRPIATNWPGRQRTLPWDKADDRMTVYNKRSEETQRGLLSDPGWQIWTGRTAQRRET